MKAIVSQVTDGDTFEIKGEWDWNGESGSKVRPTGYDTPERGTLDYQLMTNKLKKLIQGKEVELKNAVKIDRGRLVCDVYYNGKYLADYFPKYKIFSGNLSKRASKLVNSNFSLI